MRVAKRKRKARREDCNTHHILHYRRWWDKGFKQLLRRSFVFELPVNVHAKLHNEVGPVPPLDEEDARWLWIQYRLNGRKCFELFEALEWLRLNAPNSEFALAIIQQERFLRDKLDGRSM